MVLSAEIPAALAGLAQMSNRYGRDPRYVLAGGGNSSWKNGDVMFIKSSGARLGNITAGNFAGMDRRRLDALMEMRFDRLGDAEREAKVLAEIMAARLPGYDGLRPSVETPLHNLLSYTYVLHLHPALVNGMTCGTWGENTAAELFGDRMIWIPEYKPGFLLSKICEREIALYSAERGAPPKIIFMQNHGVFVSADSIAEVDAIYSDIMEKLGAKAIIKPDKAGFAVGLAVSSGQGEGGGPGSLTVYGDADGETDNGIMNDMFGKKNRYQPAGPTVKLGKGETVDIYHYFHMLITVSRHYRHVYYMNNGDIQRFLESGEKFRKLNGAFTPDHIVYCKARFLYIDACADDRDFIKSLFNEHAAFVDKYGYEPYVICVRGIGAFILAQTHDEAANARDLFADAVNVAVYSRNFGSPRFLSDDIVRFVENWEIERYRKNAGKTGG